MKLPVATLLAQKNSRVFSVEANTPVIDAVKEMNRRKIGSLIILDKGKLAGIFTERDVLQRVVVPALSAETTLVSQVMSKEVDTFSPLMPVDEALAHMNKYRHRHVPVVQDDEILGLLSIGDITRWLGRNYENEAQSLMNYFTGTYEF
jgi:CBS domain-containing protein